MLARRIEMGIFLLQVFNLNTTMLLDFNILIRGTGDPVVTLAQKALNIFRAESIVARTRFCGSIARLKPHMDRHPRVGGHRLNLGL